MNLTINVNDVSSYPSLNPTSAVITVNGVTVVGTTGTFSVPNDNTAVIEITKGGHVTYSNSIAVYGYDTTIEVFLPTIGDTNPYPSFKALQQPCSFNTVLYNTTSVVTNSRYNWTANDLEIGTTQNAIYASTGPDTIDFSVELTIGLLSGTSTEEITINEYRPSLGLLKTVDSGCDGDNTCCSATINAEVTITPVIGLNLQDSLITCAESILEYKLYDYNGLLVSTTTYNIPNNVPVDNSLYTLQFTPDILGDYKVVATLQNCCTTCTEELIVRVCDTTKVVFNGCNSYSVQNCSLVDTITFTLNDATNTPITPYENISVSPGATGTFATPGDGVYRLVVEGTEGTKIFIVVAYCSIQACVLNKILDIVCKDCNCNENCKDYCKDRFEMNRILPLAYTFFNYVNAEYALNRVYSVIDSTKAAELLNVQSVVTKLLSYCDNCSTSSITNSSSVGLDNTNDCGCN